MITIGLTGGIASGKSTVSTLLAQLGAFIVDADKIARAIVVPEMPAYKEIVDTFGRQVLNVDRSINRRLLGDIVFSDVRAKDRLEKITHPRIKQRMLELRDRAAISYSAVVLDVPLLIETGWTDMADTVWLVYVNRATQLARLMNRDALTLEQANARIATQMSLDEKINYADVVLDNNQDPEHLRRQVVAAWQSIINPPQAYAEPNIMTE